MGTCLSEVTVQKVQKAGAGAAIPLDVLDSPGAYVCNWSGCLLRVTPRALSEGGKPAFNLVGSAPLTVTKLCDDPNVPLVQARSLARDLGLMVAF